MGEFKGILIDSGRVLNDPVTGSWSYSPNFFDIVGKDNFNKIPKGKRQLAYRKAWAYINSINVVSNIEEEWRYFSQFFRILSVELPELDINAEKQKLLTDDMVLNFDKYTFFHDVAEIIPRLSEKFKLAVVSDAWPSLREVYRKADLLKYFNTMIISSELGVTKPSEEMYRTAIKDLGVNEKDIVFVDDNVKNCDGANTIGIESIVLNRDIKTRMYNRIIVRSKYKIVKDLRELEQLLQNQP